MLGILSATGLVLLRSPRWLVLVGAGASAAVFLAIALVRMTYPFELEWMEGMMVDHARWVLHGHPLYVAPSIQFVPAVYQPAYAYAAAVAMWVGGEGFTAARAVSLLATVGTALLIAALVRHETTSLYWAFVAGSLYLATFRVAGGWFDLARADSLFVLFLVLAVFLARTMPGMRGALSCATVLALAYFTKQQAIVPVAAVGLAYLLRDRRQFLSFALVWAALAGGGALLLNWASDGWYGFYTITLATQREINRRMILDFWRVDVARNLAVAAILGLYWIAQRAVSRDPAEARRLLFYAPVVLGLAGSSWLARITQSWDNGLMPALAGAALLLGIGGHDLETRLGGLRRFPAATLALFAAVALQFLAVSYDPTREVPSPEDHVAGERLMETIRAWPGDVWVAWHSSLAVRVGKTTFAHNIPLGEVLASGKSLGGLQPRALLEEEIKAALREQRFDAIILDDDGVPYFETELRAHYRRDRQVFDKGTGFWPVTGYRSRPNWIFVPRSDE